MKIIKCKTEIKKGKLYRVKLYHNTLIVRALYNITKEKEIFEYIRLWKDGKALSCLLKIGEKGYIGINNKVEKGEIIELTKDEVMVEIL